jgi:DNA polymerase I
MRYAFDIESDNFLPSMTKIHCIGMTNLDTGEYTEFVGSDAIIQAIYMLEEAELIVGHNIIGFDIPAIQIIAPSFKPKGLVRDTLVLTRLFWPHIADTDYRSPRVPNKLSGSHSLEAWGYRLNEHKFEYAGGFEKLTPEMLVYMKQDVAVTVKLWQIICKEAQKWGFDILDGTPPPSKDAIQLEHDVAAITHRVEAHGWNFSRATALELVGVLTARKQALEVELQEVFPPEIKTRTIVPKRDNKRYGYKKGVPHTSEKEVPFNPGSRQQVGKRLVALGWKPKEFNKDGTPRLDDDILSALPFPEAQLLAEYFLVQKRLGQVANGAQAWLIHLTDVSRIHGRIIPGGAHTGRMTHSAPNVAQVPAVGAPYGDLCRRCWRPDKGHVLVGCDADGLEQRTLAGYMARFDEGAYIEAVLNGDKAKGTDLHSINAAAIGCDRDTAKVFFYALIYGAGDGKLGEILGNPRFGKRGRQRLMRGVPALGRLTTTVRTLYKNRKYLQGLDGRPLFPRSENAALNTLLQSAGAVLMKRALVLFYERMKPHQWGPDWAIVGLIHDELQMTCTPDLAPVVGEACAQAIRDAGAYYKFPCPLDAQFKVGNSWEETH